MRNFLIPVLLFASLCGVCSCHSEDVRALQPDPTPTVSPSPTPFQNVCGGKDELQPKPGTSCNSERIICRGRVLQNRGLNVCDSANTTRCNAVTPFCDTHDCTHLDSECSQGLWSDQDQECVEALRPATCEDDNPCTLRDQCLHFTELGSPSCGGVLRDCVEELGNLPQCLVANCNTDKSEADACEAVPVVNGTVCNDDDLCTVLDSCEDGSCMGTLRDCNAELRPGPCHSASCNPVTGDCELVQVLDGTQCEDGRFCTVMDTCMGGACVGALRECTDSLEQCTTTECDDIEQECVVRERVDGYPCNDGDECSQADECHGGSCRGVVSENLCDDNESCTIDWCDPQFSCQHRNLNGNHCNDGRWCTQSDTCRVGKCEGRMRFLDDQVPCTVDSCSEALEQIVHEPNHSECDDELYCNGQEYCDEDRGCMNGEVPDTDDGRPCTIDDCNEDGSATHTPNHAFCGQSSQCFLPFCTLHTTSGADEADENGCIDLSLDGAECDDGEWCTVGDTCNADNECIPAFIRPCDDNRACTADSCSNELHTCINDSAPLNGSQCDDGLFCTGPDTCIGGFCSGGPAPVGSHEVCPVLTCTNLVEQCNYEVCNEDTDSYEPVPVPDETQCRDQFFCTVDDRCRAGVCESGPANTCDGMDSQCVEGVCQEDPPGCVGEPLSEDTPCTDPNPCTTEDGHCSGRSNDCIGEGLEIDDGVDCTVDSCDPEAELLHDPVDALCEDNNECTVDLCDQLQGCSNIPVEDDTPCFDGSHCTVGDTCQQGVCTPDHDYVRPADTRKICYLQGPHLGYSEEICNSECDIVILEYHDSPPVCSGLNTPMFVKYATLAVVHPGLEWCYNATMLAQHTIGEDPESPHQPVIDLSDPEVYNMVLGQYLPCVMQHGGIDGVYFDTLGSLRDHGNPVQQLSELLPFATSLMNDYMEQHPDWLFLVNDGWNTPSYGRGGGPPTRAWFEIVDSAEYHGVDLTLIFEAFWLRTNGETWCDDPRGWPACRTGLTQSFLDQIRSRVDKFAVQEHPQLDDDSQDCVVHRETECFANRQGGTAIMWPYSPQYGVITSFDTFPASRECSPLLEP